MKKTFKYKLNTLQFYTTQLGQDLAVAPFVADRRKSGFHAAWKLRRLQQQGLKSKHVKTVYLTYVQSKVQAGLLPVSEMLKPTHWAGLESIQQHCTRTILGYLPRSFSGDLCPGYQARLDSLGIECLQHRTKTRFQNFIEKNEFQPRFQKYYGLMPPLQNEERSGLCRTSVTDQQTGLCSLHLGGHNPE